VATHLGLISTSMHSSSISSMTVESARHTGAKRAGVRPRPASGNNKRDPRRPHNRARDATLQALRTLILRGRLGLVDLDAGGSRCRLIGKACHGCTQHV
jgi:hypothetical protein